MWQHVVLCVLSFTWTAPDCTVLYCTVLYCTVLYYTVLYYTVLYCTVLYCTVLYCVALYCTVIYFTLLYCTVLYCTVLYCTVLYCTVLYWYIFTLDGTNFTDTCGFYLQIFHLRAMWRSCWNVRVVTLQDSSSICVLDSTLSHFLHSWSECLPSSSLPPLLLVLLLQCSELTASSLCCTQSHDQICLYRRQVMSCLRNLTQEIATYPVPNVKNLPENKISNHPESALVLSLIL